MKRILYNAILLVSFLCWGHSFVSAQTVTRPIEPIKPLDPIDPIPLYTSYTAVPSKLAFSRVGDVRTFTVRSDTDYPFSVSIPANDNFDIQVSGKTVTLKLKRELKSSFTTLLAYNVEPYRGRPDMVNVVTCEMANYSLVDPPHIIIPKDSLIRPLDPDSIEITPLPVTLVSPTQTQNYTVSYKLRQALNLSQITGTLDVNKAIPTVTYYDGIGRAVQTVEVGETPLKRDKVLPVEYDVLGRSDVKQHLAYPLTSTGGAYQSNALADQKSYYSSAFSSADGNYAFQYTEYDNSPLNRITKTRKPGNEYQNSFVATAYSTNTASDNVLRIRCNTAEAFYINGYYPANKLYKTVTTNEEGLTVHIFSDFMDRTILERKTDGSTVMNTYYVYDDFNFGHLKWVISPEGAKNLSTSGTYSKNDNLSKQYCFYYQYNGAGDIIEKRDPGSESTYMRYNISIGHKLVANQTGSQRANNEWLLYEYYPTGELYRMYRYKYNSGYGTPAQIDSWITAGTLYQTTNVQEGGVVALYEYDRYSSGSTLTFQSISGLSLSTDQSRLKGLKTYEKVYNTDNNTYTERRFYYDSKARLIQTVERNHLGYISRYSYEYDFMGNILTAHESHQVNSSTTHTVLARNTYDHRNRLLAATTTLNNATSAMVTYAYNELGQLQTKNLGNASTITNQYNIQGWLVSQSSPKFSMALDYFSAGRRDGNITRLSWGQGTATDQYYTLSYDKFGRMTTGIHSLSKFNETIGGYDLNGNIKSLTRTANGSTSDNFTYTYNGNRLTNLSGITGTYAYDDSGNLTNDPRKSLNFAWNSLNLLQEVKNGSTIKAKYLYSYDGAKMKVQDANNANGYDYLGSLVLVKTNNTITPECNFGEGIIRGSEVMYFEKDHLGSTRTVLNASGTVLEKNDYYPFGLRHANSSYVITANNRYKFNGKEDQMVGSLGLLDFGFRMYDPMLGRWQGIDPLAEKYLSTSPYVYCANNPVNAVDPDGKRIIFVNGHWNSTFIGDLMGSTSSGKSYWGNGFSEAAQRFFNDYSMVTDNNYVDGSSFIGIGQGAKTRYSSGYRYAEKNYDKLIAGMEEGETFKFVTHSEGAAFGAGMISFLIKKGHIVETVVHLSAYQGDGFFTHESPNTYQLGYGGDWVTGNKEIEGVDRFGIVDKFQTKSDKFYYSHGSTKNAGVFKDVQALLDAIVQTGASYDVTETASGIKFTVINRY